jgi:hypothetical protein
MALSSFACTVSLVPWWDRPDCDAVSAIGVPARLVRAESKEGRVLGLGLGG